MIPRFQCYSADFQYTEYRQKSWDSFDLRDAKRISIYIKEIIDCFVDSGKTFEWCITKQHSKTNALFIHHSTLSHFIQTLTTLDLGWNEIGGEGAQHLSDALRNNRVRQILSSSIVQLFLISYRHSLHSTSWAIKSEIKGRNIWVMHYETTQWDKYSLHPSFNSFSFHTDTHYTHPRKQSNRR